MSRRRSIVSDRTKYEIARELGFADKIEFRGGNPDYGNLTTREAGSIVRRLIEKAEEAMVNGVLPTTAGNVPEPMAMDANKGTTRILDGNIDVYR